MNPSFLRTVWQKKWTVVGVAVVFVVFVVASSTMRPPVFRATCRLIAQRPAPALMGEGGTFPVSSPEGLLTLVEVLKTDDGRKRVTEKARKDGANFKEGETVRADAITSFLVRDTKLIEIRGHNRDPKRAAIIANAAGRVLVEESERVLTAPARDALAYIESQLPAASERLREASDALRLFQQTSTLLALPEGPAMVARNLDHFEGARAQVAVDLSAERQRLSRLQADLAKANEALADSDRLRDNELLRNLKSQMVQAQMKLTVARSKYTEKYPGVISDLEKEIEGLRGRLDAELEKVVAGQVGDLTVQQDMVRRVVDSEASIISMESQYEALGRIVDSYRRQLADLPSRQQQQARLQRELKLADSVYTQLLERRAALRIDASQPQGALSIIQPARPPSSPSGPSLASTLPFALLFGLAVGLLLVAFTSTGGAPPGPAGSGPTAGARNAAVACLVFGLGVSAFSMVQPVLKSSPRRSRSSVESDAKTGRTPRTGATSKGVKPHRQADLDQTMDEVAGVKASAATEKTASPSPPLPAAPKSTAQPKPIVLPPWPVAGGEGAAEFAPAPAPSSSRPVAAPSGLPPLPPVTASEPTGSGSEKSAPAGGAAANSSPDERENESEPSALDDLLASARARLPAGAKPQAPPSGDVTPDDAEKRAWRVVAFRSDSMDEALDAVRDLRGAGMATKLVVVRVPAGQQFEVECRAEGDLKQAEEMVTRLRSLGYRAGAPSAVTE